MALKFFITGCKKVKYGIANGEIKIKFKEKIAQKWSVPGRCAFELP